MVDTDRYHNHTYYGNGCPNVWDTSIPNTYGGSNVACSTRIVKDGNNEDQKNGTYYNSQAATSGASAAITTDNTNSPDTFCPLGWQLPYGGTGGDYYDKSRSMYYLFGKYSYVSASSSPKIRTYPISYIPAGDYYWGKGLLYNQTFHISAWLITIKDAGNNYSLWASNASLSPQSTHNKIHGITLRCLRRRHGGRDRYIKYS